MEINLKEKLRSLRQQKNITQETLANYLRITPQSVGKWERGEGFPDITLLPKIAFYFDVTVDELLCVDQVRVEEAITKYKRQAAVYQNNGENDKNLELWEKAYAEFPNDCGVIEQLMFAINRKAQYPCPKDEADRIIALGEELLAKSTDAMQREHAVQYLCYTYDGIDNEKALYYANMGGSIHATREGLKSTILQGEEGVVACQTYIETLIHSAAMSAVDMTSKTNFSPEETIEAYTFAIDILKRLFSDDNVGFYAYDLSFYYRCIASQYVKLNDKENVLKNLKESCRYAIIEANLNDMDYTAPMVNRLKHKKQNISKNYKGNACNLRIEGLKDKMFDFVRDEDEFKQIIADLEKHAEKD
ncbi:MAG: helix-turn-helix transcriptional regulator [Clostridia bacterium]|nr:helix-turn-helix transcriptional regulator [Clostridia bacterium]